MFIKRHGPPGTSPATLSPHLVDGKIRKPSIQLVIFKKIKWLCSGAERDDFRGFSTKVPSLALLKALVDG